jgi:hypothetical protein
MESSRQIPVRTFANWNELDLYYGRNPEFARLNNPGNAYGREF